MMTIYKIKLNKDLLKRNAAELVFKLNNIPASVYINKINSTRKINGKSLIGILSEKMLSGTNIEISTDNLDEIEKIKSIFINYSDNKR